MMTGIPVKECAGRNREVRKDGSGYDRHVGARMKQYKSSEAIQGTGRLKDPRKPIGTLSSWAQQEWGKTEMARY